MDIFFHNLMNSPAFNWLNRLLGLDNAPLLPTDSKQGRPLTIVVSIMCALGCISALSARIGFRAADSWTSELKSALTILVEQPRDEQSMARAIQITTQTNGVTSAKEMSRDSAKQLLKNYGANIGSLIDELPLPAIIEVGIDGKTRDMSKRLFDNLTAQGFKIEIDDHSRYSAEILRTSAVLRIAAILALLALIGASLATIGFAARAVLETQRECVQILHLIGAEDEFIISEVQARFLRLGLLAGLIGAAVAGLLVMSSTLIMQSNSSSLTSGTKLLSIFDIWILFVAPFVTGIVSAVAARFAAGETLKELI